MNKTKRLLARMSTVGLGLLLFVAMLRPASEAYATSGQPLALAEPAVAGAPGVSEWGPVIEDTYDGTYETNYSVPRVIGTTGVPFQWGRVTRGANPFFNTLWCVQGWSGASLIPGNHNYPDGVNTTIVYGPLDLREAKSLELSFRHWVSVAEGDGLAWAVSVASPPLNYLPVVPTVQGQWESTTLDSDTTPELAALLGQDAVYLSFRFRSNSDGQVDKGVFLDDLQLWGDIYTRLYLPLVSRADPGFRDDFSDITSGWPVRWEVNQKKPEEIEMHGGYMLARSSEQAWADLMASRTEEDKDPVEGDRWAMDPTGLVLQAERARFLASDKEVYYALIYDDWDLAFIAGPHEADGDFDVEVRGRINYVQRWFQGNRYGLLLSKEPVHPEDPHTVHGYSFELEMNPKDDGTAFDPGGWRFKEWYRTNWKGDDCSKDPCDEDQDLSIHTSSAIRQKLGDWNTLRIERRGTEFKLYINGTKVKTLSDDDNVGPYYVGLIARHMGSPAGEIAYNVQFEWDNLVVTPQ